MQVRVAAVGQSPITVDVEEGSTLGDALGKAFPDKQVGGEVRVNNEQAGNGAALREGDVITIVPQIRGGK